MNQTDTDTLAQIIWDYHHLNHPLSRADCLFVLGSHDARVAEYAADLFLRGYAPYIVFSGGYGNFTKDVFARPEADLFADIAEQRGVPPDKILRENRSTNTGENVAFTKQLLAEKGLAFQRFILIQKPYMERRTFATFKKVWPEKEFIVTSPPIPFAEYPNAEISKDRVINIMVGDLQRIRVYPDRGFQIFQEIPAAVWSAYEQLVARGFTQHLLRE